MRIEGNTLCDVLLNNSCGYKFDGKFSDSITCIKIRLVYVDTVHSLEAKWYSSRIMVKNISIDGDIKWKK